MATNKSIKSPAFWLALLIVIVAGLLIIATSAGWFRLRMVFWGEPVHHWFGYIGAGFIGVYLPVFAVFKRRYPRGLKTLLTIHMFGNLLAFTLISLHFAHHLTRPSQAFPDLGTGIALIAALMILITSGFVVRFQLARSRWKSWHWLHTGTMISFYLIIFIHILHGLRFI